MPGLFLVLGIGAVAYYGFRFFTTDSQHYQGGLVRPFSGTPTAEMSAWASSIVNDPTSNYGDTFSRDFAGRSVLAVVEHHTWTYRDGVKIEGQFKGVTLYDA
jgi:hypothetical protein